MTKWTIPAPTRLGWVSLVLGVLLVGLVGAGVWLFVQWQDRRGEQERYDEVVAAARAETLAFITLDYRELKPALDRVLEGATGDFKKEYAAQREAIETVTRDRKSVSKGSVASAGVVSMDADSARVIVVADTRVTNVSTKEPQPRHLRLQLDLVLEDGEWLTSDLAFVG